MQWAVDVGSSGCDVSRESLRCDQTRIIQGSFGKHDESSALSKRTHFAILAHMTGPRIQIIASKALRSCTNSLLPRHTDGYDFALALALVSLFAGIIHCLKLYECHAQGHPCRRSPGLEYGSLHTIEETAEPVVTLRHHLLYLTASALLLPASRISPCHSRGSRATVKGGLLDCCS